jgi:hypothetical protein
MNLPRLADESLPRPAAACAVLVGQRKFVGKALAFVDLPEALFLHLEDSDRLHGPPPGDVSLTSLPNTPFSSPAASTSFQLPDHVHWQSLHQNHIYKVLNRYLQSAIALCLILRFTLRYCLPLHIERCILLPCVGAGGCAETLTDSAKPGSRKVLRPAVLTIE